jgi:NADH:ubiquinone reductase (H+-translocating)
LRRRAGGFNFDETARCRRIAFISFMVFDMTQTGKSFGVDRRHEVVIIGGGAGGIELASRLGRLRSATGRIGVTLVDKRRMHVWKPMLHSIAAGSIDPAAHEIDFFAQAHWRGFTYRLGELVGLDRTAKQVLLAPALDEEGGEITPAGRISYDTLIIAIGSVSNDFGAPGVAEFAIPLETPEQAVRFNRRLVNACIRANAQPEPVRPGQLHVAIVGAGATGTELAAELHQTVSRVVGYGFDKIDPEKDVRIILIEGADHILPGLPPRISVAAAGLLAKLNIDVRTNARVKEIRRDGIVLANGEFIPAELSIWAAGVKGPDVLSRLDGLEVNQALQLVVRSTLETSRDPNVFAFGDCADCPWVGHEGSVPPRAQAAHQQALHMVGQIERRLAGQPLTPYVYTDFGSLVSLGDYGAVGSLMGFLSGKGIFVDGFVARLMYRSLYQRHLVALYGGSRALFGALGRTLSRRAAPIVKLH